jgi:CBS domain-containing protein
MKTAQDFILEIPVLKNSDPITKHGRSSGMAASGKSMLWTGKPLPGYIDLTDGLRVTATKSNVTVEGFVKDSPMANPEESIEQVAKTMQSFHTDSVAVIDSAKHMQGGACWDC